MVLSGGSQGLHLRVLSVCRHVILDKSCFCAQISLPTNLGIRLENSYFSNNLLPLALCTNGRVRFLGWVKDAHPYTTVTPAGESRVISLGRGAWKSWSHVRENHVDSWRSAAKLDQADWEEWLLQVSSLPPPLLSDITYHSSDTAPN